MKPVRTETLDISLGYSLRRAQMSTYADYDALMAKFAVRPSQYAVLMLIAENPGLSQNAVCGTLGIQKANFVAVIDRLEARGLTERRKLAEDRRSTALFLTPKGARLCAKLQAAHAEHEERLTARLGPRRAAQLLKLLHEFSVRHDEGV